MIITLGYRRRSHEIVPDLEILRIENDEEKPFPLRDAFQCGEGVMYFFVYLYLLSH